MVDFLLEVNLELGDYEVTQSYTVSSKKFERKVYVDGASNDTGYRTGLFLVSLKREEIASALRFYFLTTNNEAEYETVITGLQLVKHLKAERVK